MVAFLDDHRAEYGVAPICKVLQFAPSTYYEDKSRAPSARALGDAQLTPVIKQLHEANYAVYGYRKMGHALRREGHAVPRCRVQRLMRELGLTGAVRGRAFTRTTPPTRRRGRRTWSSGISPSTRPTGCGSAT